MRSKTVRLGLLVALACSLLGREGFGQQDQDEDEIPKIVKEDITLRAKDGWPIHITYYQASTGEETPVVVLLHREGGNRQVWTARNGFANKLWNKDYAVVAIDLRKHGQSVPQRASIVEDITAQDRQKMAALDMETVKKFIFEEHQKKHLNMSKMAIIAPEMSAAVAVNYAMLDWMKPPYDDNPNPRFRTPRGQDVRVLILLSPEESPPGLPTGKALNKLKNPKWDVAFLICYGTRDPLDDGAARKIYSLITRGRAAGKTKNKFINPYPHKYRGTDLIGPNNPKTRCEEQMLGFLEQYLDGRPWQDRRSRLVR